jgi:hypothetical protein
MAGLPRLPAVCVAFRELSRLPVDFAAESKVDPTSAAPVAPATPEKPPPPASKPADKVCARVITSENADIRGWLICTPLPLQSPPNILATIMNSPHFSIAKRTTLLFSGMVIATYCGVAASCQTLEWPVGLGMVCCVMFPASPPMCFVQPLAVLPIRMW